MHTKALMSIGTCLTVVLSLAVAGTARRPAEDQRAQVNELVVRFVAAFETLDIDAFMACFASEATVFFPAPEPADRYDGKAAIRTHFQQVFSGIRNASHAVAPPYHRLDVENLEIQMLDPDAAVVTFHLRNAERIARRTLVVGRIRGRWLIVHLHASNMPLAHEAARP